MAVVDVIVSKLNEIPLQEARDTRGLLEELFYRPLRRADDFLIKPWDRPSEFTRDFARLSNSLLAASQAALAYDNAYTIIFGSSRFHVRGLNVEEISQPEDLFKDAAEALTTRACALIKQGRHLEAGGFLGAYISSVANPNIEAGIFGALGPLVQEIIDKHYSSDTREAVDFLSAFKENARPIVAKDCSVECIRLRPETWNRIRASNLKT